MIDVDEAMKPGAPMLHEDMITSGVEPAPTKPSNIVQAWEFTLGDVEDGFAGRRGRRDAFTTAPVHQGYIEPHACVASVDGDGQGEIWASARASSWSAPTPPGCWT